MHIPVLTNEVLQYLDPKPNDNFIDCTIGEGGHAVAILERNRPEGKVLGIEIDREIYQESKGRMAEFSNRLVLINHSYANLKEIVEKNNFRPVQGILLDLGMSTWHLEKSGRGFTFLKDEPLKMNYLWSELTAEKVVNEYSEQAIEKILREYGEERFAGKIAREIVKIRETKPIKSTFQLAEIIKKATPAWYRRQRINPATKTFQALRIAVNQELENLKMVLPQAIEILEPGGRMAVISFHSLEDRIVKNFFKERSQKNSLKILTKKPIIAADEEIMNNPSSRSAKLRAAQKI